MKKRLTIILTIAIVAAIFSITGLIRKNHIKITINGAAQSYDKNAVILNDQVLVPIGSIFENLGTNVEWIEASQTIVVSRDGLYVKFKIDSNTGTINGKKFTMDVPAQIINKKIMLPVRTVCEALGEKVSWNNATKTLDITSDYLKKVAVQDGLAKLPSTLHRPIPTEFEKSNEMSDLIFYAENNIEEMFSSLPEGNVLFSAQDFIENWTLDGSKKNSDQYGTVSVVDVEGQPFKKALKVETNIIPEAANKHAIKLGRCFKDKYKEGDDILFTFAVKLDNGGDENGRGKIFLSVQETTSGSFKKLISTAFTVTNNWARISIPVKAKKDYDEVQIRFAYCDAPQTIEIADFQIINYAGNNIGNNDLPVSFGEQTAELQSNAAWRADAIAEIEQIRKGDFKVIVKDKRGKVIPNADVDFTMFESAFPLGTCINGRFVIDSDLQNEFSKYFNGAVIENDMKWGNYVNRNSNYSLNARSQIEAARKMGAKYIRGHVMIMDYPVGSSLFPKDVYDNIKNKDYIDKAIKNWIYNVSDEFAGEIFQWDVANEIIGTNRTITGEYGYEYMKDWFEWAREVNPGAKLFITEGGLMWENKDSFTKILDALKNTGAKVDSVGFQSHYDKRYRTPQQISEYYNEIYDKYGYRTAATEFTCDIENDIYQANMTRDFFITSFANEHIDCIFLWGFKQGKTFAENAVFLNADGSLKESGKQIVDLYYNKWWTRNAKTSTNTRGEATIRGFYGDYDVTVTVNGQTKTVMAAFRNGYKNVLEITLD